MCVAICVWCLKDSYISPLALFFKGSEQAQSNLPSQKKSTPFNTSLLVIGCLLFLLCGFWLLTTIVWLHRTSDHQPQGHPKPVSVHSADFTGRNESVSRQEACTSIPQDWRFDCYPERGVIVTRELCEARNCCFVPAWTNSSSARPAAGRAVPWCFYPTDFPSYSLVLLNDTPLGKKGKLVREVKTYYPADILVLNIELRYETATRLRVRVSKGSVLRFFFIELNIQ